MVCLVSLKGKQAYISLQEAGPESRPAPEESSTEAGRRSVISDPELICMLCGESVIFSQSRGGDGYAAFELPRVFPVMSVIKYALPGSQWGSG